MRKQPTYEEYRRLELKYYNLLSHAKRQADDPTGLLSRLYHDIIDKYCATRMQVTRLRQENSRLKKLLLRTEDVTHKQEKVDLL